MKHVSLHEFVPVTIDVILNGVYIGIYVFICSVVSLTLSTTISVSREKHRFNVGTLVSADFSDSPDRLTYTVHWVCHASKSVPYQIEGPTSVGPLIQK